MCQLEKKDIEIGMSATDCLAGREQCAILANSLTTSINDFAVLWRDIVLYEVTILFRTVTEDLSVSIMVSGKLWDSCVVKRRRSKLRSFKSLKNRRLPLTPRAGLESEFLDFAIFLPGDLTKWLIWF